MFFSWAGGFLVVALIAAVAGLTGFAGAAAPIVWTIFTVALALFVGSAVIGCQRGEG